MTMFGKIRDLTRDSEGSMAIETAIAATTLSLMSLGSFQVSTMVSRQHELQAAAAEAAGIALAAKPDTTEKLATVKTILMTSTGLPTDKVSVSFLYRCGTDTTTSTNSSSCGSSGSGSDGGGGDSNNRQWQFVRIQLSDTYTPMWTNFGVGSNVNLRVDRTVQIK